jgi:hypothetical protein
MKAPKPKLKKAVKKLRKALKAASRRNLAVLQIAVGQAQVAVRKATFRTTVNAGGEFSLSTFNSLRSM